MKYFKLSYFVGLVMLLGVSLHAKTVHNVAILTIAPLSSNAPTIQSSFPHVLEFIDIDEEEVETQDDNELEKEKKIFTFSNPVSLRFAFNCIACPKIFILKRLSRLSFYKSPQSFLQVFRL